MSFHIQQFCLLTKPFIKKYCSSLKIIFRLKLGPSFKGHRLSTIKRRCVWASGSIECYTGVGPSRNVKFTKLKSVNGRVLVQGEVLTALGSSEALHVVLRCSLLIKHCKVDEGSTRGTFAPTYTHFHKKTKRSPTSTRRNWKTLY